MKKLVQFFLLLLTIAGISSCSSSNNDQAVTASEVQAMLAEFQESLLDSQRVMLLRAEQDEVYGLIDISDEYGEAYKLSPSTSSVLSARIMKIVEKMKAMPRSVVDSRYSGYNLPPLTEKDGRIIHSFVNYTGDEVVPWKQTIAYEISYDDLQLADRGFYNFSIAYKMPTSYNSRILREVTVQISVDAKGNGIGGQMFGGYSYGRDWFNFWSSECDEDMYDAFRWRIEDVEHMVDSLANASKKDIQS